MRNRQKFLAVMLAAVQLAAFSACGGESSSTGDSQVSVAEETTTAPADTTTASAETTTSPATDTTAAGTEGSDTPSGTAQSGGSSAGSVTQPAVGNIKAGSQSDLDAAKAALDGFMTACQSADRSEMEKHANLSLYKDLMLAQEITDPDEQKEAYDDLIDSIGRVTSYTVDAGKLRPELLTCYLEELSGFDDELAELDADERAEAEAFYAKLPHPDMLAVFPTTIVMPDEEGNPDEDSSDMYVIHTADGWQVDMVMLPTIFGFTLGMQISSANAYARRLQTAATTALTDLDAEGVDLSLFNGTVHVSESEVTGGFKAPESITTREDAKAALLAKMTEYYSDFTILTEFSFIVKDGACTAAAVQRDGIGSMPLFGCYPHDFTADDFAVITDLDAALTLAQRAD